MIALKVTKWSQQSDLCPTVTKRLQLAVISPLIKCTFRQFLWNEMPVPA
jgi:hypothetical protein